MDLRFGVDGRWHPVVDAWQATGEGDYAILLQRLAEAGLRHVLTTDVAHDGMAAGPNLALYRELAARWPSFAWIASGGVRNLADVDALRATGVAACVAGTALLEGSLSLESLASESGNAAAAPHPLPSPRQGEWNASRRAARDGIPD
jgi:phosphoribosylformimino-5-aminoimidazole carboxamide ribotide isomerase